MKHLLTLLLITLSFSSFSQLSAVRGATAYPFWMNLPADSILTNKPPILIFLHGKSLSGTDLSRVRKYGVIHEMDKGRKIPAIVVAPQVANGAWNPDKVLEILQYVQKNYNTDSARIYVVGMSLGGYGTFDFAGKHADKITAGVAMCGGGNPRTACNIATIPFWVIHGNRDYAVPISKSVEMVKAIRSCNGGTNLLFTEVPGADHGDLERIFRTDELYEWLFKQVRTRTGD